MNINDGNNLDLDPYKHLSQVNKEVDDFYEEVVPKPGWFKAFFSSTDPKLQEIQQLMTGIRESEAQAKQLDDQARTAGGEKDKLNLQNRAFSLYEGLIDNRIKLASKLNQFVMGRQDSSTKAAPDWKMTLGLYKAAGKIVIQTQQKLDVARTVFKAIESKTNELAYTRRNYSTLQPKDVGLDKDDLSRETIDKEISTLKTLITDKKLPFPKVELEDNKSLQITERLLFLMKKRNSYNVEDIEILADEIKHRQELAKAEGSVGVEAKEELILLLQKKDQLDSREREQHLALTLMEFEYLKLVLKNSPENAVDLGEHLVKFKSEVEQILNRIAKTADREPSSFRKACEEAWLVCARSAHEALHEKIAAETSGKQEAGTEKLTQKQEQFRVCEWTLENLNSYLFNLQTKIASETDAPARTILEESAKNLFALQQSIGQERDKLWFGLRGLEANAKYKDWKSEEKKLRVQLKHEHKLFQPEKQDIETSWVLMGSKERTEGSDDEDHSSESMTRSIDSVHSDMTISSTDSRRSLKKSQTAISFGGGFLRRAKQLELLDTTTDDIPTLQQKLKSTQQYLDKGLRPYVAFAQRYVQAVHNELEELKSEKERLTLDKTREVREILWVKFRINELEKQLIVAQLSLDGHQTDLEAHRKQIRDIQKRIDLLTAQENVMEALDPESAKKVLKGFGASLTEGLWKLAGVATTATGFATTSTSAYKWRNQPWGRLLIEHDQTTSSLVANFEESINTQKDYMNKLKAKVQVLKQVCKKMAEAKYESIDLDEQDQLDERIEKADAVLMAMSADVRSYEINMRATMLQRLVDVIGDRHKAVNAIVKEIEQKKKNIAQIEQNIRQMGERAKAENIAERDRLTARIAEARVNIDKANQRIKKLDGDKRKLIADIQALNVGYNRYMSKYEVLDTPKRTLGDMLKKESADKLKSIVTLGYMNTSYVSPQQFEVKKQFADLGYHWQVGLAEFSNVKGDNVAAVIKEQVKDFLVWADSHPTAAESLLADVALTASCLADQAAVDSLSTAIRARLYTRAALGEIGRDLVAEPRITEKDFRYMALADLAKWGPVAASIPSILQSIGEGWSKGGFAGALTDGAVKAVTKGGGNTLLQQVVKEISPQNLQAATMALGAIRGDSISDILAEQRRLTLLQMAGDARRGLVEPKTLFRGILQGFKNDLDAIKTSWNNGRRGEAVLRTFVRIGLPIIGGVGAAGFVVAGLLTPIGWVVAGAAILAALTVAIVAPRALRGPLNSLFSNTMPEVRKARVQSILDEDREEKFKEQTRAYLVDLRKKGVLLAENLKGKTLESDVNMLAGELILRLRQRVAAQRTDLNADLTASEVSAAFRHVLSEARDASSVVVIGLQGKTMRQHLQEIAKNKVPKPETETTVKAMVLAGLQKEAGLTRSLVQQYGDEESAYEHLSQDLKEALISKELTSQRKIYADKLYAALENKLVREWLEKELTAAFKAQFVTMVIRYETPEHYESAKKESEAHQKAVAKKMEEQLIDGLPKDNETRALFEKEFTKQRGELIPA